MLLIEGSACRLVYTGYDYQRIAIIACSCERALPSDNIRMQGQREASPSCRVTWPSTTSPQLVGTRYAKTDI
jgi:hypothetical protein